MMNRMSALAVLCAVLAFVSCEKITFGQRDANSSSWLSSVPDSVTVASLSVPGSHDAATFRIDLPVIDGLAKTQVLDIASQLRYGVRAFDLRPSFVNNRLEIYHGVVDTGVSLAEAVGDIMDYLDEFPSEFAIVVIRHEDEGDGGSAGWKAAMMDFLSALPEDKVLKDFDPMVTVGQMRGRILFLSRDEYGDEPVGAYIGGWYSGTDILRQKSANINDADLWVQDYYDPAGKEDKLDAIKTLMNDYAADAGPGVWCINHTSGYVPGVLGIPDYGENAQNVNAPTAAFIDALPGSAGIVMMDFAGVSSYESRSVGGDILLKAVINHN